MSASVVLDRAPNTLALLPKLAMSGFSRKGGSTLPALSVARNGVKIDVDALAAYNSVCGFTNDGYLPTTYAFVLAFPLHMVLFTLPEFPFPAMGLVHISNRITQHRRVRVSETLDVSVRTGALEPHDKGLAFSLITEIRSNGELVLVNEGTMLFRTKGGGKKDGDKPQLAVANNGYVWKVPADIGRRYAAVAGDRNPIHLYAFTAKLLGFPRAIAHGMWTKARCLAALESRLPDAFTVDVLFKLPVLLPATVRFDSADSAEGLSFRVNDAKSGKPHLSGVITAR